MNDQIKQKFKSVGRFLKVWAVGPESLSMPARAGWVAAFATGVSIALFVTPENLVGLFRQGGIGTLLAFLSLALVGLLHLVELVVITLGLGVEKVWRRFYPKPATWADTEPGDTK